MKRYVPTVFAACIGLCAGFAVCYLCLVIPHREGNANASAPQNMTVIISHDGSVYLAGERLDVSQLAPRLKELGAKQSVVIRADSSTDYRRFVEVVDACKAASVHLTAMTAQ